MSPAGQAARGLARRPRPEGGEAGLTLVEVLVAMLVLTVGLLGIANLFVLAGGSNSVARQGTAATTSAMQTLERLRATPYAALRASLGGAEAAGDLDLGECRHAAFARCDRVPGVGLVAVRWRVVEVGPGLLHITVRAEGTGLLSRRRSRAEFTTFRSCTVAAAGCP